MSKPKTKRKNKSKSRKPKAVEAPAAPAISPEEEQKLVSRLERAAAYNKRLGLEGPGATRERRKYHKVLGEKASTAGVN